MVMKMCYNINLNNTKGEKTIMKKLCIIVNPATNYICYNWQHPLSPDMDVSPHAPISCLTEARGSEARGGTAFMTELCCPTCAKALGGAGIKKLVYQSERVEDDGKETRDILEYYGIDVVHNTNLCLNKET